VAKRMLLEKRHQLVIIALEVRSWDLACLHAGWGEEMMSFDIFGSLCHWVVETVTLIALMLQLCNVFVGP